MECKLHCNVICADTCVICVYCGILCIASDYLCLSICIHAVSVLVDNNISSLPATTPSQHYILCSSSSIAAELVLDTLFIVDDGWKRRVHQGGEQ